MLASIFEKRLIKFSCNFDLTLAGVLELSNAELFAICLVVFLLFSLFVSTTISTRFRRIIVPQTILPHRAGVYSLEHSTTCCSA